jgi:hypothetical protein
MGPGVPDQERELVQKLMEKVFRFEMGVGKDFRERCERFYRQYRGFRAFQDHWTKVGPNDRDAMLYDAKKHWGAHLHIPLSFRTIETIVPKAIAHAPKVLVEPRDEQWRKNVESVRLLIARQQEQIDIDLALQAVMRSGRMYGLGIGKGLALDTPLPTPTGWVQMGNVRPGTQLLSEQGRPCSVKRVSDVKELACYRITFEDGASLVCDADHLWTTIGLSDRKRLGEAGETADWRDGWTKARTQRAEDLAERVYAQEGNGQKWHLVPTTRPLDLADAELPIEPYLLGAWLGDGTSAHGAITSMDPPILQQIEAAGQATKVRPSTLAHTAHGYSLPGLERKLRDLGVLKNKHIPTVYLRASRIQRLELLRGLMDTDGSHLRHGTCEIGLCRKVLADDMAELLRSMGWKVRRYEQPTRGPLATPGGRVYRLNFTPDICPFRLPRKAERWQPSKQAIRATGRHIASIEPVETVPTQCIEVDSPSELFLAGEDMVPTHNTYWRKEVVNRRRMEQRVFRRGFTLGKLTPEVTFDDPMFEDLDVFDFGWDPYGSDMRTCEWTYHRVWMSTEAVIARLGEGVWQTESAKVLKPDDIRGMGGGGQRYDEIWKDRMEVSGFRSWATFGERGEQPHELIEWHDGERVLTILDRQVLVQDAENPCCGMMPFQIYRPTPLSKQFVGIGDLEPLEHLQRELDTLRSQRRDAATIALCAGYAFDDGIINEEDLQFGPNAAIRVNGNPNEALLPLHVREVPGSGYQEEAAIVSNIEAVSGLQDALNPSPSSSTTQTATEAQLVQASLSARIELGSRRFEIEVVRALGRSMLYLDQRMITEDRPALMVPEEGVTPEEAMETGAWREYPIGPGELLGEYEIMMEGGSMAARNIPQDRADAAQLMNMFAHSWYINPTKPLERALELMGVKHPKAWMRAQEPPIPAMALSFLKLAGVDPTLIEQAVMKARTVSAPQEGPTADQVTGMLGGAPVAGAAAAGAGAAASPAPAAAGGAHL